MKKLFFLLFLLSLSSIAFGQGTRENGQSCGSSDQCISGNCQSICCPAGKTCCESNEECSSGICNTWDYYCEARSGEPFGAYCATNSECESGYCNNSLCCLQGITCCNELHMDVCPSGFTCVPGHYKCETSTPSSYCGDGSCNGSETCSSCSTDCGSCPSTGTKNYCESCSDDSECASDYCGNFGSGGNKCANPDVETYCCDDGFYIPNFQYGVDCCDACTDEQGGIYTRDCINHKCFEREKKEEETGRGNIAPGRECTNEFQCENGWCNNSHCCSYPGYCCSSSEDCPEGYKCNEKFSCESTLTNLLKNPGFEDEADQSWINFGTAPYAKSTAIDFVYMGNNSFSANNFTGDIYNQSGGACQKVSVIPNKKYTASAWINVFPDYAPVSFYLTTAEPQTGQLGDCKEEDNLKDKVMPFGERECNVCAKWDQFKVNCIPSASTLYVCLAVSSLEYRTKAQFDEIVLAEAPAEEQPQIQEQQPSQTPQPEQQTKQEQQNKIDLKAPSSVLGRNLTGISDLAAARYDADNSLSNYFGLSWEQYIDVAQTWHDVANYELRKGKLHITNAKNMGLFNFLNLGIKKLYNLASFLDSASQLSGQMQKLSLIRNPSELVENTENLSTLIGFTDNMISVTGTIAESGSSNEIKVTNDDRTFFSALKENALWSLSTAASGGWTLLADASSSLANDNVNESIAYETESGNLSMFMALHAEKAQRIAEKENPTADELKEYFFSVKSLIKMKKLDAALKYRDDTAIWKKENKGLFTKALYFVAGASKTEALLNEKKAFLDATNRDYDDMEKNVDEIMKLYGVELK